MSDTSNPALSATGIVAGYGRRDILRGIDVTVAKGEIVAVIGHNGAGKSTLLKALFGVLPARAGKIAVSGATVRAINPEQMISRGVSYLPQGNRVFADLSVYENLQMGGYVLRDKHVRAERIAYVVSHFPQLGAHANQRAGTLSGGQKQVLALATALVSDPHLLLLDEPSLGLAPGLAREALTHVRDLCKTQAISALIVEQKVREVLNIADRVYALRGGHITYSGPVEPLRSLDVLKEVYL